MDEVIRDIEEALVAHWSHLGRWPRGELVEQGGTLRYETPIPHLPYNGVLRTHLEGDDPDRAIADVVDSFGRRGVPFLWWEHPSSDPADLGRHLAAHGLNPVEHVTGMSIELDGWSAERCGRVSDMTRCSTRRRCPVTRDLIVSYWELPKESQVLVADLNRFWGPGRLPAHRYLAHDNGEPVGKALLSLAGSPGVAAIYGMSVQPKARGKGVAQGLTATALRHAQELGCHRVVLHSSAMAVGLHRRARFVERCSLTVYATTRLLSSGEH